MCVLCYGQITKSGREIPFCIMHCSFCVDNCNGSVWGFLCCDFGGWNAVSEVCWSRGEGPAFSTADSAGLCSGSWHRAALSVPGCIRGSSSPVAWAKLACGVSAELFLHFKCTAGNSFLIRQLEWIARLCLAVSIFICCPGFLTIPQRLALPVFGCVVLPFSLNL